MSNVKFWLEDPASILQSFKLIPSDKDTIEEKINAITRIVIIVFIILLIAKQKHATVFLVVSLIVICLAYYYQKSQKHQDQYKKDDEVVHFDQEERFMAHAGGKNGYKTIPDKAHPRRPYPAAIPEDFVVRNQNGEGQTRDDLDEDPRHTYLVALRKKAEALEREEEIQKLEAKLNIGNKTFIHADEEVEEYDNLEFIEEVKVQPRIYLDVGEEDYDTSDKVHINNRENSTRRKFRFGSKKQAFDPRMRQPVDPMELMISRQRQVYGKNREIVAGTRKAMMNNI